jgi:hypothetical protein
LELLLPAASINTFKTTGFLGLLLSLPLASLNKLTIQKAVERIGGE